MAHDPFNFENLKGDPRFARFTTRLGGQPSWVMKFAALAAGLVILVPIVALILAALGTFLIVYVVLTLIRIVVESLERLFGSKNAPPPEDDGRKNVRVIRADS